VQQLLRVNSNAGPDVLLSAADFLWQGIAAVGTQLFVVGEKSGDGVLIGVTP